MGQQLQRQKSIPAYMTLFYFATLLVLGSVRVFLWPAVENEEQEELDQVLQPVCVCSFTSDALPGALSVPGRVRTCVCVMTLISCRVQPQAGTASFHASVSFAFQNLHMDRGIPSVAVPPKSS